MTTAVIEADRRLAAARATRQPCTPARVLALGPMVPVAPGDSFRARISGIGEIRAVFTESPVSAERAIVTEGQA